MAKVNWKNVSITISVIAIIIVLSILGASYAYFGGLIGNSSTTSVQVSAKTIDGLTFSKGDDINIIANQDNFNSVSGNLSASTTSTVTLSGNNAASSSYYYKVYLVISDNNYVYTQGTTPELLLTVSKNNTIIINNLDITTRKGIVDIPISSSSSALKHTITASSGGSSIDSFTATITFVNLNANQNDNAGKKLSANLYFERIDLLPSRYQEVEYIANSGTQYINLDLTPTSTMSTEIIYMDTAATSSNYVLGSRTDPSSTINYAISGAQATLAISLSYAGASSYTFGLTRTANILYRVEIDINHNTSGYRIHGKLQNLTNGGTYEGYGSYTQTVLASNVAPLCVFGFNSSNIHKGMRLYKLNLYEGNSRIAQLIPCYDTQDNNKIGLYDTVRGMFLTNAGSGTFTKGANVNG